MITTQVTMVVGEGNPHDFGSIKTVIIERFDEQYVIVIVDATVVATATVSSMGGSGQKVILVPGLQRYKAPRVRRGQGPVRGHEVVLDMEGSFCTILVWKIGRSGAPKTFYMWV